MANNVMFPTVYQMFPILRHIFIRENINLLHAHQAFSSMAQEAILHASTMGIKCVFTDHSLFSFENTRCVLTLSFTIFSSAILTNKLLKFTLSQPMQVICVSHTSKVYSAFVNLLYFLQRLHDDFRKTRCCAQP